MPPFLRSFLSPTFFTLSLQLSHWFSEPYPPLLVTVFPSLVVRLFLKWCSLKWKPHTILFLSLFTFFILVFSRRHKHFKLNKWCFGITKMREKKSLQIVILFCFADIFFWRPASVRGQHTYSTFDLDGWFSSCPDFSLAKKPALLSEPIMSHLFRPPGSLLVVALKSRLAPSDVFLYSNRLF